MEEKYRNELNANLKLCNLYKVSKMLIFVVQRPTLMCGMIQI